MQNNNNTIDNNFIIIERLGEGGFSQIYKVRRVNENNEYAAKVRRNNPNNQNGFPQELQMTTLASGLNNPNIIHLEGHGQEQSIFKEKL